MAQPIRVGVVGVRRGMNFARQAGPHLGMELAAICDAWEERLEAAGRDLGVATYTDYDAFLQHRMDAVVLANYFHEHAPFAIRALEAGKHVLSETSACFTLAEGVALIEAVEKSDRIYMFAENCPYMRFNQEMRRLYRSGTIGEFRYGEGEYVHPMDSEFTNRIAPGVDHWRNWIPATYYNTHSLAPIMYITDTRPVKVNGFVMAYDADDEVQFGRTARRNDLASMIAVRMDNGALVKLLKGGLRGHGHWMRIHGNRGLIENMRVGDRDRVRLRREPFDTESGEAEERIYLPDFPERHEEAMQSGHGGADFFMNHEFSRAIRAGEPPFLDVYRGVAMSIVGILAYRSALNDSNTVEVPDFRRPEVRAQYADDDWNPDPARRKEGYPWPSVLGDIAPPPEGLACARNVWREMGYEEKEG